MTTFRDVYKEYAADLRHILREPTDAEIAALMPIDHPLALDKMTVGQWLEFRKTLWESVQVSEIVKIIVTERKWA